MLLFDLEKTIGEERGGGTDSTYCKSFFAWLKWFALAGMRLFASDNGKVALCAIDLQPRLVCQEGGADIETRHDRKALVVALSCH